MQYYTCRALGKKIFKNQWLVESFLPTSGWFLLIGEPGVGKSTFVLQLCEAIHHGKEFLTLSTFQTDVMYVQADSSEVEWAQMIKRITPDSEVGTIVDVPTNVLSIPGEREKLARFIDKQEPGFIVWDSLYKLSNVNMNTNAILQPIREMEVISNGKPFLVIHHPTKDMSAGVYSSSGHNSLSGACSIYMNLRKTKLTIEKGRLIKTGDIRLKRRENGEWYVDISKDKMKEQFGEMKIDYNLIKDNKDNLRNIK